MGQNRAAFYVAVPLVLGSLSAFLVDSWLCLWPSPHPLSPTAAFLRAITYVSAAVLSGAASLCLFWVPVRSASSVPLSLLIVASAIGWVWVPSVVLLSRQRSIAAVLFATIAAVVMAIGLRKSMPSRTRTPPDAAWKQRELFADYLNTAPREREGFLIAVCLYGGFFALHKNAFGAASFVFAFCAFLLTWALIGDAAFRSRNRQNRFQALRLARAASAAIVITTGLLLMVIPRGISSGSMDAFASDLRSYGKRVPPQRRLPGNSAADFAGYERIVLWPIPEKKKVALQPPARNSPTGFNLRKPVTIRFNGAYWYFQPRGNRQGTRAHVNRGNPLNVDIRSVNYIPLIMEAHQWLAAPIPLECCRQIEVTIENNDNAVGVMALGVLLTDSTSLGKPTLYLDQQTIVSTEPGLFTVKSSAVSEVLRFGVPNHPRIGQFDEITVIFFPDSERPYRAARIAIKQFDLIPR
jgi:hypothetical protein